MKKIYLFLLVTVLAFAGHQKSAYAGGSICTTVIETFVVTDPTSSIYPFGIVDGTYSGSIVLSGDLFYEGSFLMAYQSGDGTIFLADLDPGNYEFVTCAGSQFFTINGLACDITILNIGATNVSGAGCAANGMVDLTVGSSNPGPFFYNLTELLTAAEYTGQDDGFGIINISNLPAGVYTLFVSTEQDVLLSTCNANTLVIIEEPLCDMAINSSTANDASGQGAMDGSISASISGSSCIPSPPGGNPIYVVYAELNGVYYGDLTYNPVNFLYELNGLGAGTYTVVAENGGTTCFATTDLIVGEPGCNITTPVVFATNTTICNGAPAILGVPNIYDSYQWVYNGSFLITTGLVGIDPVYWAYLEGNYSCIVTLNGCTATSNEVFVSAPLSPEINFPDTVYSCGSSVVMTSPLDFDNYLWSTFETTPSITITSDGWYGLAAGVSSLVCGVVDSFYVSLNNTAPSVSINIIGANPFCTGASITLESVLNAPNPVLWSTNETSGSIVVNTTGNYTVEVTSTIGCTATASVSVVSQSCVPTTQLTNSNCGNTAFVRTSSISCTPVSGATQYEWQFSNGNGVYATKLTTTSYVALHNVTPILNWGTTWTVKVRAIIGANSGTFGSPCTIGIIIDPAIGGVPTTQLRPQDCGKLNYRINADNRIITNFVAGAIQYEFEFSTVGANPIVFATVLRPNTVLFLNTVTPALVFPAQYTVRTRARIATVWSPFGAPCLIGIIGLNRDEAQTAEELQFDADGNVVSIDAPYFDLNAMPNPYNDITSIIINSSINENVYVQFYDMTGKLVEDIKVATNERFNVGANLSQGIYLLKARSDSGNQVSTRLVKTN